MRYLLIIILTTQAYALHPFVTRPEPGIQTATEIRNITATIDKGGHVYTPGPRGNWYTKASDIYVALPDPCWASKKVLVRSKKTGRIIEVPMWDLGPWSTKDHFLCEKRRPWAESGKTNLRKYRGRIPSKGPGIDLSHGAVLALGETAGMSFYQRDNYSTVVDVIVIDRVIDRPAR